MKLYPMTDIKNKSSVQKEGLLCSINCEDTLLVSKELSKFMPINRNRCIFLCDLYLVNIKEDCTVVVDSDSLNINSLFIADRCAAGMIYNGVVAGVNRDIKEGCHRYIESLIPFTEYIKDKASIDSEYDDVEILYTRDIACKNILDIK